MGKTVCFLSFRKLPIFNFGLNPAIWKKFLPKLKMSSSGRFMALNSLTQSYIHLHFGCSQSAQFQLGLEVRQRRRQCKRQQIRSIIKNIFFTILLNQILLYHKFQALSVSFITFMIFFSFFVVHNFLCQFFFD